MKRKEAESYIKKRVKKDGKSVYDRFDAVRVARGGAIFANDDEDQFMAQEGAKFGAQEGAPIETAGNLMLINSLSTREMGELLATAYVNSLKENSFRTWFFPNEQVIFERKKQPRKIAKKLKRAVRKLRNS